MSSPERSRREQRNQIHQTQMETAFHTEENHNPWGVYDSNLRRAIIGKSIEASFRCVLPEHGNIRRYVETQLAPFAGHAVGMEFGGTASNLFNGFSYGFFERTAGVNLT